MKKPKPFISASVKRRLAIQKPEEPPKPDAHGVNCICLYCRSRGKQ